MTLSVLPVWRWVAQGIRDRIAWPSEALRQQELVRPALTTIALRGSRQDRPDPELLRWPNELVIERGVS